METPIYIQKKLTPEVLEGLEDNKDYYLIVNGGTKQCLLGSTLKEAILVQKNYNPFTHTLLPITVTSDMMEKEAKRKWRGNFGETCFKEGVDWLLNLNKEEEK